MAANIVILPSQEVEFKSNIGDSVWITVGKFSLHLKHGDEGVSATFYPLDREDRCSIAETYVFHDQADDDDEPEDVGPSWEDMSWEERANDFSSGIQNTYPPPTKS